MAWHRSAATIVLESEDLLVLLFRSAGDLRTLSAAASVCRGWRAVASVERERLQCLKHHLSFGSRGKAAHRMDHPGAIVALPPLPAPPDAPEWTGRHLLVCEHGRFRLLRRPTAADSAQLHEQFAYKSRPLGATSRLRFPIGQLPFTFRGSTLASSMALSEDGQRLYLSDFGANRVISCSIPRNYVESQIDFLSWGWRYLCSIGGSDSEQEGHVSRTLSWANDLTREPPEGCTPLELSAASALCLALNKDAEANPYVLGPGALLCVPETAITRLFWRAFRLVCSLTMAFANRHAHMVIVVH